MLHTLFTLVHLAFTSDPGLFFPLAVFVMVPVASLCAFSMALTDYDYTTGRTYIRVSWGFLAWSVVWTAITVGLCMGILAAFAPYMA